MQRICHADDEWLSPLSAEFARTRPRDLVPRPPRRHGPRAGGTDDPGTRLENRIGEPAANPYLYIASQIVAGLDGIDNGRDPGPPDDEPYCRPSANVADELAGALWMRSNGIACSPRSLDDVRRLLSQLKRNETGRFAQWLKDNGIEDRR